MTTPPPITPVLQVRDIRRTLDFYTNTLDFAFRWAVTAEREAFEVLADSGDKTLTYASVGRGEQSLMFQLHGNYSDDEDFLRSADPGNSAVSLYTTVEDADALYDKLRGKTDVLLELNTAWYGMREFSIRDPDGYILAFGHSVPEAYQPSN